MIGAFQSSSTQSSGSTTFAVSAFRPPGALLVVAIGLSAAQQRRVHLSGAPGTNAEAVFRAVQFKPRTSEA
eukprot:3687799-Alexandrium_andersonii.AAC.1